MKYLYSTPSVKLVKINEQDIITESYKYDGDEIDAGGSMSGGGIELPSIPGLISDN